MTKNVFLISDTHFGHANIINFMRVDGVTPLRPFSSVEEMDETLVSNWNSVVSPSDTVYHLGDVVINRKSLNIVSRLNGKKRLIRGNHDIFKTKEYIAAGFEEIRGVHVLNGLILSHIPLHPNCVTRFGVNVHGHLHEHQMPGPYFSVCVEQINYTPIELNDLRKRIVNNEN